MSTAAQTPHSPTRGLIISRGNQTVLWDVDNVKVVADEHQGWVALQISWGARASDEVILKAIDSFVPLGAAVAYEGEEHISWKPFQRKEILATDC